MNINSVSSNNYSMPSQQQNDSNSVINLLEKQKMQLKDQIKSVNESKLDVKSKRERISQIEEQIQQLDMQIQQIQMESMKRKLEKKQSQEDNKSKDDNTDENISSMADLVQADNSYSQAKSVNASKKDLVGKRNVIQMEISLDAGRFGGETRGKSLELSELNYRISSLDKSYGEKLNKSLKAVDKSNKENDDEGKTPDKVAKDKNNSDAQNTKAADIKEKDDNKTDKDIDEKNHKRIDILI